MGKIDKPEPVEKELQGRDKSFNNRHQGFKQDGDARTQNDRQATGERSERGLESQRVNDRHQGFKPGEASEATKAEEHKRPGTGEIPQADVLSKAGQEPDKGDLTRAGREFYKHGKRYPEVWGLPEGNAETLNNCGQERLDSIISSPDTQWNTRHHARFGYVVEGQLPDRRGARWSADGRKFECFCFLDPPRTRS